jgi:hypothetical protein
MEGNRLAEHRRPELKRVYLPSSISSVDNDYPFCGYCLYGSIRLAGSYDSGRKKLPIYSTDAQLYDIIGSVIDCKEVLTGFKLRHAWWFSV